MRTDEHDPADVPPHDLAGEALLAGNHPPRSVLVEQDSVAPVLVRRSLAGVQQSRGMVVVVAEDEERLHLFAGERLPARESLPPGIHDDLKLVKRPLMAYVAGDDDGADALGGEAPERLLEREGGLAVPLPYVRVGDCADLDDGRLHRPQRIRPGTGRRQRTYETPP